MIVADVLSRKGPLVTRVRAGVRISEAVAVMAGQGIGSVVVEDDRGALAGIFTERDLVRVIDAHGPAVLSRPVAQAMTADPVTCGRGDKIGDVLDTMSRRHFRHMPVVEDGAVVGIVSIRDLVLGRLDAVETEAEAMRAYLAGS